MMKFKLQNHKLIHLFEMLTVDDMISQPVISVEEDRLSSIQNEEHARALRVLNVNTSYFEEFDCPGEESIEIDIEKITSYLKNIKSDKILTVETKNNNLLLITGEDVKIKTRFTRQTEVTKNKFLKKSPLEIKNGVPVVGEDKIPMDVHFSINLDDFKKVATLIDDIETTIFKFRIGDEKIVVAEILGDADRHGFTNSISLSFPDAKITMGAEKTLKVGFTYGIEQIASTFKNKIIEVKTGTDVPAWFIEKTDEYELDVLIPPYLEEEEEEETDADDAFIEATLERLIPMLQKRHPELFEKSEDVNGENRKQ